MIWGCFVLFFWFGDVFGDDFVTADSNPMSKTAGSSRKHPKTTNQRPTNGPREVIESIQEYYNVSVTGSMVEMYCHRERILLGIIFGMCYDVF